MDKKKGVKKENLGKYFLLGTIAAVILFVIFSLFIKKDNAGETQVIHVWSVEYDSAFVKNCYNKYRPQIKDDIQKRETTKSFCRCMLAKIKTKYAENEADKMTDAEIKQWDAECRNQLLNPNNILIK